MAKQKTLKEKKAEEKQTGKIMETVDSWMGTNGKAVFINIDIKDIDNLPVTESEEHGDKVTLITSVEVLERLLARKIKGLKLSYFKVE